MYYSTRNDNLQIWGRYNNFIYNYIAGWSMFLHARSGNTTRPLSGNLQIWGSYNNFIYNYIAGWSSLAARWAHNPKVASSNLAPATNLIINVRLIYKENPYKNQRSGSSVG